MEQIHAFVAAHLAFLADRERYRVVTSEVSGHHGGDSVLVLESDHFRLRLVTDETQLFLDVQSLAGSPREWWSIDLVRRLLLGRRESSAVLDEGYAAFLTDHLAGIEARFAPESWPGTRAGLRALRTARSKEMSG